MPLRRSFSQIPKVLSFHQRSATGNSVDGVLVQLEGFQLIETVVSLILVQMGIHLSHLLQSRQAILNFFELEKDLMLSLSLRLIVPHRNSRIFVIQTALEW